MTKKTICILGGGTGGIVTANLLKKSLKNNAEVILIDKNPFHLFEPSMLWLLTSKRQPEQIKRNLNELERKGIKVINAEVEKIEPKSNLIKIDGKEIKYDYLVTALGAQPNLTAIKGLKEAAINLYSIDGILEIKEQLKHFKSGEIVILIPSMPYKCPAAPYEASFIINEQLLKNGLKDRVKISIYTFESLPMPTAGPQIGNMIKDLLDSRGINYNTEIAIQEVNPTNKEMIFKDGKRKKADLLITIPPHKSSDVVKEALLTNEAGWIAVDSKTLKTKYDNIYAIGDITAIKLEGKYKPDKPLMLPKAGVFARKEAEIVANNISSKIKGVGKQKEFDGKGACFLDLGDGTAGFATGNFFDFPHPSIKLKTPGRKWLYLKTLYEKYWFWHWL